MGGAAGDAYGAYRTYAGYGTQPALPRTVSPHDTSDTPSGSEVSVKEGAR
ncbi:hypothetical protein Slala05_71390 [Streptomyces lavendulae subsp. lavendulae]|nr:hypothetical protein Slala05_71390 [Streptomyces lavendulae subsp. lavendulae]